MSERWAQSKDTKTEESEELTTGGATQATETKVGSRAQAKEATKSKGNAPFQEKMAPSGSAIPIKDLTTAITELISVLNREKAKSDDQHNPLSRQEVSSVLGDKEKYPQNLEASKGSESTPAPMHQDIRIGLLGDEDYTRKYPNDEYGAEMYPNARVWRTYIDERDIADKDYISDNNATLDGILVFASIFSAIVTTFVTQTYQSLVPDPQAASQGLLSELIAVQRGAANGSSVNAIPSYDSSSPMFKPETADVWLNSLWFISLMFSLLTAFLGVLAKQWLYQYVSVTSGTPRDRALVRQARSLGLHDWQVPALIGFLPIILHLSLALFLVGLIILLHSALPNIAYFGIALVGTVYAAYIISNLLPVIYPRCPYRTALTPKIYQLYHFLPSFPRLHIGAVQKDAKACTWRLSHWQGLAWLRGLKLFIALHPSAKKAALWKDAERADALNTRGALEAKALSWLYGSSFNPTAQQIVLEAFAGLNPGLDQYEGNWDDDLIPRVLEDLRHQCTRLSSVPTPTENTDRKLELYLRALVHIQPFCEFLSPRTEDMPGPQYRFIFPAGVEEYVRQRKLKSSCNVFLQNLAQSAEWAVSIWDPEMPPPTTGHSSFTDSQLSAGIWKALIQQLDARCKAKNLHPSWLQSYPEIIFKWHAQSLEITQKAGFFTNTVRNDNPFMTLWNPNTDMCEALFNSVIQYSDLKQSSTRIQVLFHFILKFLSVDSHSLPEEFSDIIILTLQCIVESVRNEISVVDAWSCSDTELLVELISRSEQQRWKPGRPIQVFQWNTLWLLERFCIARHLDLLPTSVLNAWVVPAINTCLDGIRTWDDKYKVYLQDEECVGLDLLRWAFDQQVGNVYDTMFTDKFFWQVREWQRDSLHANGQDTFASQTLRILAQRLLGGIFTEKERDIADPATVPAYVERVVDQIHEPENLEAFCQLLLVTPEGQEPGPLLRLLSLKPTHHAWSAAIVQVKRRCQIRLTSDYISAVLQDILAIQNILNIHAHNSVLDYDSLKALSWHGGEKVPADNKEIKILVAHRLASDVRTLDEPVRMQGGLQSWWQNRLRDVFSFRKREAVSDVEVNQLP